MSDQMNFDLNAPRPNLWAIADESVVPFFADGVPESTFKNRRAAIKAAARKCLFYSDGIFYRAVALPNTKGVSPQQRGDRP